MRIEKANISQVITIVQLLKELYLELGEEESSIVFLKKELIQQMLDSSQTEIYLVFNHNEEPVGIATITECQSIYAGGKYGLIDEMFISPGYRSKKIGSLIIDTIKRIGNEKGWKRIDVTAPTEERWKRTVDFYEKCGFVFTGPKLKLQLS